MARQDVLVVDHPAVADRLARLRDRDAPVPIFRRMVEEIGLFLAYEATRSLRTTETTVRTPLEPATARRIARRPGHVARLPQLHRRRRDRAPRVLPRSGVARAGAVLRQHAAQPGRARRVR